MLCEAGCWFNLRHAEHSPCVAAISGVRGCIIQLTFALILLYNISVKVGDRLEKRCNQKTVS